MTRTAENPRPGRRAHRACPADPDPGPFGKPSTAGARTARALAGLAFGLALVCGPLAAARAQDTAAAPEPSPDESPVFSIDSPIGRFAYRAGRGLQFGDTGLTVGGFTSLEFDREEGRSGELEIDGVNFLVLLQPVDFFRGFAEIEVEEVFSVQTDGDGPDSHANVEAKRLYGDLLFAEAATLRVGKFQTPVGRWNLVPAEPFVWTAIEPVLTEVVFDEHQTGAALTGSFHPGDGTLDYWVYGQAVDPLDPDSDPEPGDHSVGGRLEFGRALEGWSVGASTLATEKNGDWSYLGGLDAEWQIGRLGLTSEFVVQEGEVEDRDVWAVYLQGVFELVPTLYAVGRYEHFDPSGSRDDSNLFDLGGAWIPVPWIHFRASYRFADEQTDEVRRGVSASISVVF